MAEDADREHDAPPAADAEPSDATGATDAGATGDGAAEEEPTDDAAGARADGFDLRSVLKQFTAPMIESLDARLREQVEVHADEVLQQKVDAAVADRLSTVDRAIADLSRAVEALEHRLSSLERGAEPLELE